jgi:hypothetical protein
MGTSNGISAYMPVQCVREGASSGPLKGYTCAAKDLYDVRSMLLLPCLCALQEGPLSVVRRALLPVQHVTNIHRRPRLARPQNQAKASLGGVACDDLPRAGICFKHLSDCRWRASSPGMAIPSGPRAMLLQRLQPPLSRCTHAVAALGRRRTRTYSHFHVPPGLCCLSACAAAGAAGRGRAAGGQAADG